MTEAKKRSRNSCRSGWKWSQGTVSLVETGERPLRIAEAVDLAKVLGLISVDALMMEKGTSIVLAQMRRVGAANAKLEKAIEEYWDAQDQLSIAVEEVEVDPESRLGEVVLDWLLKDPEDVAGTLRAKAKAEGKLELERIGMTPEDARSTQGLYMRARNEKWDSYDQNPEKA